MNSVSLTNRAIRFAISGLLVTGMHVAVAALFIQFVLYAPSLANGIAFAVATLFSYLINTKWSFSSQIQRTNFYRFLFVSVTGCLIAMSVSGLAEYYRFHYLLGITLVVVTVPPFTFILHNFWTYRR